MFHYSLLMRVRQVAESAPRCHVFDNKLHLLLLQDPHRREHTYY